MGASHDENTAAVREYFDRVAPDFRDLDCETVDRLLSVIPLEKGERVLDVACGAGVLDACLLKRGLIVDAIDISPKMIERAKRNMSNLGVNYYVGDFCALDGGGYDYLLVFDAYPHFIDKDRFCEAAQRLLKVGGMLWIFFDQSKESINARHGEKADIVSVLLLPAEQEVKKFEKTFETVYLRDNGGGYYLGLKKKSDKIF